MFKALATLLAQVASLTTSMVANEDGTITVTVIPKAKKDGGEASASLNTPLTLTGTPEELDAEFATILASYTSKRSSLAEQLAATEAVLEAAKKDSVKKATSKTVTKAAPAKTAEKSCGDGGCGDDDNDDDTGSTGGEVAQSSAAPDAGDSENLWG